MRNSIIKRAEQYNERFIVAGPHWSWGSGYPTEDAARKALEGNRGYGYHKCPKCGRWIAGLAELPCANCK